MAGILEEHVISDVVCSYSSPARAMFPSLSHTLPVLMGVWSSARAQLFVCLYSSLVAGAIVVCVAGKGCDQCI